MPQQFTDRKPQATGSPADDRLLSLSRMNNTLRQPADASGLTCGSDSLF
jgi:hypothetical protein